MYDNVHIFLPGPDGGPPPDVSRYLDNAKGGDVDMETGEAGSIYGGLKGARVTIYPRAGGGIKFNGSLSKFMYGGRNLRTIDRRGAAEAVEMMSDLLHVDMREASVTYLEFGANMAMRKPPPAYIAKLGELPRFEAVSLTKGSRRYTPRGAKKKNPPKKLVFYDKADEAVRDGVSINEIEFLFGGPHVLRYELAYRYRLAEQLDWPEKVTASTLSEPEFYRTLADKWMEYYRKIKKDDGGGAYVPPETVRDAKQALLGRFLVKAGPDCRAAYIDELKNAGTFKHRSDYTRLKKELDSIAEKAAAASGPDEDIRELDEAVRGQWELHSG